MCGIVGIYHLDSRPVDVKILQNMSAVLCHRGPDDEGYYVEENIGLGHRRLSIIDLSPAGHQPMSNEDDSIWITYNGEVYNYVELMAELKTRGHGFRSRTDTEVIIHAYEEWGEGCLNRFNGMFAFALWDSRRKKLFCARDRLGIKPFYFFYDGKQFIFASEIKTIIESLSSHIRPNDQIIYDYLVYGLLDHTEKTFFYDIQQLRPSHYLVLENGRLEVERWWDLHIHVNDLIEKSDEEYARRFYEIFEDSIRLHLRSDVPIGTCLSGGLDSSSIVCVTNKLLFSGKSLCDPTIIEQYQKTFSSCSDLIEYDEREYINAVLKHTGAEANSVFPKGEELFDIISTIIWHQDEPFGSTSIVAQWYVMKLAAENRIKVLLDGQGADELLAGYHGYLGSHYLDLIKSLRLVRLLRELIYYKQHHSQIQPYIVANLARAIFPSSVVRFLRRRIKRDSYCLDKDFQKGYSSSFEYVDKFRSQLNNHLYSFLFTHSLPALLHYEDRNSMAFSIEARVPFLDHRLVEFMFSLPADQKIRNGTTKIVLRNAMKGILPEKVRTRQDKMGFVTPEDIWFRTLAKDKILEIINSRSFKERGYFNVGQIKSEFNAHCRGEKNISKAIWRWINLELWFRRFFHQ